MGDSGAWVVNALTGDLHGIIVAPDEEAGITYMLRARDVLDDMRSVTRGVVTLPHSLSAHTIEQTTSKLPRIRVMEYHGRRAPIVLDDVVKSHTSHYNIISQQAYTLLGSPHMDDTSQDGPADAVGKIELRWSYLNEPRSWATNFYVVPRISGEHDAILSEETEPLNMVIPPVYLTKLTQQTDQKNAQA